MFLKIVGLILKGLNKHGKAEGEWSNLYYMAIIV